jgi:hypothetical protein
MDPVTIDDRKNELHTLLAQMQSKPSRDWTAERMRVAILQQMIAAAGKPKARA